MTKYVSILDSPIEYLKGVGPARGELLRKELNVHYVRDLLYHFPFRYVDKTQFHLIKDVNQDGQKIQLKGQLIYLEKIGTGPKARIKANFKDSSGFIDLVWFKGIKWIAKNLVEGEEYIVYGSLKIYNGMKSIVHPDVEKINPNSPQKNKSKLEPVYPSTDLLTTRRLDSKARTKLIQNIFEQGDINHIKESLPQYCLDKLKLCTRLQSLKWVHLPENQTQIDAAQNRLKFEELFFIQLRMLKGKIDRQYKIVGLNFSIIGQYFNKFYKENLPFELTNAQKRVLKEIRANVKSGAQMNRLLQGDVGSGKTIVGLLTMLMAIDNGYQSCLMAPTEILARQHHESINEYAKGLGLKIEFLSGSIKGKKREAILKALAIGDINILIGTHALIEDPVKFKALGLAITDEQHRFGVAQRAKLWAKNKNTPPHILVMTATPIPRTLAMTVYGDLDVSVIDELPPGRKDIQTVHRGEGKRTEVYQFIKSEIDKGRQIYMVFPLIEESAKLDLQNLQHGYERLLPHFPKPKYQISVVHGRMKADDKNWEMDRFVKGTSQIMVATTVIEVGVNVPNASVMIIENANRFGLSQLHQLRGRVGRGADQSYCILMTDYKLSKEAKERLKIMCQTNNGFEISEADLRLRGHGNIEGIQQSGALNLRMASIIQDQEILTTARHIAMEILQSDPDLKSDKNIILQRNLKLSKKTIGWGRIS